MENSILVDIKKLLGMTEEYEPFDKDIVIHINSAFVTLRQLGVGPVEGFRISDETAIWSDFIQDNKILGMVKDYVYLKVKMIFDPPSNSNVMEAYKESIREYEFRLNVDVDPGSTEKEGE